MMALTKVLAGGIAAAAVFSAAPAAAQYYPGYGYGNGGVVGSIINSVTGQPGYGYGYNGYGQGYGNYGMNQQAAVGQCTAAVQQRLGGGYGGGYGYSPYGGAGGGRVLGISRVEPRGDGGLTIRGVASSGAYGYGNQPDLTFRCRTDYRGFVNDVSVNRATSNYGGYGYAQPYNYNNYNTGPYGYSRY